MVLQQGFLDSLFTTITLSGEGTRVFHNGTDFIVFSGSNPDNPSITYFRIDGSNVISFNIDNTNVFDFAVNPVNDSYYTLYTSFSNINYTAEQSYSFSGLKTSGNSFLDDFDYSYRLTETGIENFPDVYSGIAYPEIISGLAQDFWSEVYVSQIPTESGSVIQWSVDYSIPSGNTFNYRFFNGVIDSGTFTLVSGNNYVQGSPVFNTTAGDFANISQDLQVFDLQSDISDVESVEIPWRYYNNTAYPPTYIGTAPSGVRDDNPQEVLVIEKQDAFDLPTLLNVFQVPHTSSGTFGLEVTATGYQQIDFTSTPTSGYSNPVANWTITSVSDVGIGNYNDKASLSGLVVDVTTTGSIIFTNGLKFTWGPVDFNGEIDGAGDPVDGFQNLSQDGGPYNGVRDVWISGVSITGTIEFEHVPSGTESVNFDPGSFLANGSSIVELREFLPYYGFDPLTETSFSGDLTFGVILSGYQEFQDVAVDPSFVGGLTGITVPSATTAYWEVIGFTGDSVDADGIIGTQYDVLGPLPYSGVPDSINISENPYNVNFKQVAFSGLRYETPIDLLDNLANISGVVITGTTTLSGFIYNSKEIQHSGTASLERGPDGGNFYYTVDFPFSSSGNSSILSEYQSDESIPLTAFTTPTGTIDSVFYDSLFTTASGGSSISGYDLALGIDLIDSTGLLEETILSNFDPFNISVAISSLSGLELVLNTSGINHYRYVTDFENVSNEFQNIVTSANTQMLVSESGLAYVKISGSIYDIVLDSGIYPTSGTVNEMSSTGINLYSGVIEEEASWLAFNRTRNEFIQYYIDDLNQTLKTIDITPTGLITGSGRLFLNDSPTLLFLHGLDHNTLFSLESGSLNRYNIDEDLTAFATINSDNLVLKANSTETAKITVEAINAWGDPISDQIVVISISGNGIVASGDVTPSPTPVVLEASGTLNVSGIEEFTYLAGSEAGFVTISAVIDV